MATNAMGHGWGREGGGEGLQAFLDCLRRGIDLVCLLCLSRSLTYALTVESALGSSVCSS